MEVQRVSFKNCETLKKIENRKNSTIYNEYKPV